MVMTPGGASSSVCWSLAATNACTPTTASPPGRLSTTTGRCHRSASRGAQQTRSHVGAAPGAERNNQANRPERPVVPSFARRAGHGEQRDQDDRATRASPQHDDASHEARTALLPRGRLPAPGRAYSRFASMTRTSMSISDRRSAAVRTDRMRSCAACAFGRCRSWSACPLLTESKHPRAAILAVHGPFDEPPLLQSIDDRAGSRPVERQAVGQRVLIKAWRLVEVDHHAELERMSPVPSWTSAATATAICGTAVRGR